MLFRTIQRGIVQSRNNVRKIRVYSSGIVKGFLVVETGALNWMLRPIPW